MRLHPDSTRLRQLVPPTAIVGIVAGALLSRRHRPLALLPGTYAAVVAATAARARQPLIVLVAPLIHGAWSLGIIAGALRSPEDGRAG